MILDVSKQTSVFYNIKKIHPLLLQTSYSGIRCIKGDKDQVTEVTESAAVHFTVEYSRNVQKIA